MKYIYLQTDFPNGRSHLLMRNVNLKSHELRHYLLVLSNRGKLWVDVFWPYDDECEKHTRILTESQFWHTFREWRLKGFVLGDNEQVAQVLAQRRLNKKEGLQDYIV